jgi:hypothetical protein
VKLLTLAPQEVRKTALQADGMTIELRTLLNRSAMIQRE